MIASVLRFGLCNVFPHKSRQPEESWDPPTRLMLLNFKSQETAAFALHQRGGCFRERSSSSRRRRKAGVSNEAMCERKTSNAAGIPQDGFRWAVNHPTWTQTLSGRLSGVCVQGRRWWSPLAACYSTGNRQKTCCLRHRNIHYCSGLAFRFQSTGLLVGGACKLGLEFQVWSRKVKEECFNSSQALVEIRVSNMLA